MVDPESDFYHQTVDLRFRELREPLGLTFTAEDLAAEADQMTLALSNGEQALAVLMLKPVNEKVVKVRQVAVDRDFQGRGLGKMLSEYAEDFARNCGYNEIVLHARKTAVDFYKKLDYIIDSEEFEEVSIPHFRMHKKL